MDRANILLLALPAAACRAAPVEPAPAPQLVVQSGFGPDHGVYETLLRSAGSPDVPHGLRTESQHGVLRQAAVYEHGRLVRHDWLHASGFQFISSWLQPDGSGHVDLWTSAGELAYTGRVRERRRWDGHFVVVELLRATYGRIRVALYEYQDGALVGSQPFPFERFGLPALAPDAGLSDWSWPSCGWPEPERVTVDA